MTPAWHRKFSELIRRCEEKEIEHLQKDTKIQLQYTDHTNIVTKKGKPFFFYADFSYLKEERLCLCVHKDHSELMQLKISLLRKQGFYVEEY